MRHFLAATILCVSALRAGAECIPSGDETDINRALNGPKAAATLCRKARFRLHHPVVLSADGQEIGTDGSPGEDSRASLFVDDPDLATAITSRASGIHIHHLIVDGRRTVLGRMAKGGALIEVGGEVHDVHIDHIRAMDPRGWSTLHIFEGNRLCTHAVVEDNRLGPAGTPDGAWADGISLACRNSRVARNEVIDASDGGIVVFGSPGSVIEHNTVMTRTNTLLGGINLVDYQPFEGDYSGTIVRHNRIVAEGGYIKVGIAIGPSVWGGDNKSVIRGAKVVDNIVSGEHLGFGIAVDGAEDLEVGGNEVRSKFQGRRGRGCYAETSIPAAPMVRNPARSTGSYQQEFVQGVVRYAICVTP
jgi:hypothetical protein